MNLISKSTINGSEIYYYEGIDFDKVLSHPKNGSAGMMIIFIENWKIEVDKWKRNKKINSLIKNEDLPDFDNIIDLDNNYISIYQAESIGIELLYETIKSKMQRGLILDQPWIPVTGIDKGAWKIGKYKAVN